MAWTPEGFGDLKMCCPRSRPYRWFSRTLSSCRTACQFLAEEEQVFDIISVELSDPEIIAGTPLQFQTETTRGPQ
jgi:hypothetical protein